MAGDPSSNGTAVQRVDWSALRAYIAGKEAFEAEHGRPAPLTDHEVSAIAILLRPAPRPEPDLGKTNWLGLLNHFQQVRNQKVTFTDEARQEQGLGKAKELRWACSATFDSTGDVFPQPGYGMDAGEDVSRGGAGPSFPGKKDAKQWAAKAACEWLIDNGHMMPSGDLPKFPKPFAPAASAALAAAAAASAPAPAPAPSPSPSRGVSSGSVLPSKRSPPSSPPTESSADASRKKQDTNQPPKTSPSLPAQAPSTTASNSTSTSSSLPSHQASPPTSTQPSRAPKSTLPLNVTASPTSAAAQDSTTTSTASTPSLGGTGVPITAAAAAATAQSQVPTPAISPAPTSTPARVSTPATSGQESATATTSAEKRVRDLCAQLHFPVPRYVLTPDPALEDFWEGRADFDGNPRIPDDLGTVRRVLPKKAARERMADAIVIWLEGEVVKRERTAKLLLGK